MKHYRQFQLRGWSVGLSWQFEWKVQDAWVGAFWKSSESKLFHGGDLWVCLLPCIPLHVQAWWIKL